MGITHPRSGINEILATALSPVPNSLYSVTNCHRNGQSHISHPWTTSRSRRTSDPESAETPSNPQLRTTIPTQSSLSHRIYMFREHSLLPQAKKLWWCSGYHIQGIYGTWRTSVLWWQRYWEGRRFESYPRSLLVGNKDLCFSQAISFRCCCSFLVRLCVMERGLWSAI
jgi:hypothetical protein